MPKKTIESCLICCEDFNKSNHKLIGCQYCNYKVCSTCAETYLLNTTLDAHCMNPECKKAWSHEFISNIFTKKFVSGTYKKRREELLFERERSLLPETQPYAEYMKQIHDVEILINPINEKMIKTKVEINKYQNEYWRITNTDQKLEYHKKLLDLKVQLFTLKSEKEFLTYKQAIIQRKLSGDNINQDEKRTFVRACPSNTCKGFLSTAWKCGLCEVRVCAQCHEIKETKEQYDARHPKEGQVEPAPEHTCKPENVETAKLLKNECKNCPKCAASIFKLEGCDQMWCPMCQTAFSWRTGKVETGTVHNPHYYEYLRRQNNGVIPRNPGDIPCGGLPTAYDIRKHLERLKVIGITYNNILHLHRIHGHINAVEIPHYTVNNVVNENRDLRAA